MAKAALVVREILDALYRPRQLFWLELFEKPAKLSLPPLPAWTLKSGIEEVKWIRCRALGIVVAQYSLKFGTHMNFGISIIESGIEVEKHHWGCSNANEWFGQDV